jgi:hypothetical protein
MQEPFPLSAPVGAAPDDSSKDPSAAALLLATAAEHGRAAQDALRPDDPRLDGTVHLAYRDGANLTLPHAFIEGQGDWLYVFTRDHGYFVAHKDIVATCTSTQTTAQWTAADRRDGTSAVNRV